MAGKRHHYEPDGYSTILTAGPSRLPTTTPGPGLLISGCKCIMYVYVYIVKFPTSNKVCTYTRAHVCADGLPYTETPMCCFTLQCYVCHVLHCRHTLQGLAPSEQAREPHFAASLPPVALTHGR